MFFQIPEIVRRLTDPTEGIKLTEKKSLLKVHRNCFTGSELIDWFINKRYVVNRTTGVALGGILMKEGVIYCASPKGSIHFFCLAFHPLTYDTTHIYIQEHTVTDL
jgi:hypothetical protein